jgi:hypothetical protein
MNHALSSKDSLVIHTPRTFCALACATLTAWAAMSLAPPEAVGFEQTMTCTEAGPWACGPDEEASPVQWPSTCVSYHLNDQGTANADDVAAGMSDVLEDTVVASFDAWHDVDCSTMKLSYEGQTSNDRAEVKSGSNATNMNLVVFRDEGWSQVASAQTFALTSVSYNPDTGVIVDADVEINSEFYTLTVEETPDANQVDLRNTLVHEVGHFIGLDHTPIQDATMYASADLGEIKKRQLHQDDIDGICHIYPVIDGEDADQCQSPSACEHQGQMCESGEDCPDGYECGNGTCRSVVAECSSGGSGDGGCCATQPARPSSPSGWLVVIIAALGLLVWRRGVLTTR